MHPPEGEIENLERQNADLRKALRKAELRIGLAEMRIRQAYAELRTSYPHDPHGGGVRNCLDSLGSYVKMLEEEERGEEEGE